MSDTSKGKGGSEGPPCPMDAVTSTSATEAMTDVSKGKGWLASRKGTTKGGPCPDCGHALSRVYDGGNDAEPTRRWRECSRCGTRWTTVEVFERRIA